MAKKLKQTTNERTYKMSKKLIKVMDTSFRDGFQSVYGARVFVEDFLPALKSAVNAGIKHFEVAGGS